MSFNTSYILNESLPVKESKYIEQLLLKNVADGLPFAQNVTNFATPNNPIVQPGDSSAWDAPETGIHHPKLFYNPLWAKNWRVYYKGVDSGGVGKTGFAEAAHPTGTWTKHSTPIMSASESFEDLTYGVNGLTFSHVKGIGFVGLYGYKRSSDGKISTGKAVSSDGITWTGKTQCVFDEKLNAFSSVIHITDVIYEPENGRYIACAHVASNTIPLMCAILTSTDAVNWKTKSIISGSVGYGTEKFDEPFDVFGIAKTGSTYIVFGHRWIEGDFGDGTKVYKNGYYAVSVDLDNWFMGDKPMGLAQGSRDVGRYGHWVLGHDAWWGVHTVNYPLEIALIRLPITKPGYTYILNNATIATGVSSPSERWISPDESMKKIGITAQIRYGATVGAVKIRIIPMVIPSGLQHFGYKATNAIEFTLPQVAANGYSREYFKLDDLPDKFAVEMVNESGSPITDVSLRISFKE